MRRLREVLAYANRFVQIFDDEVRFGDGSTGRYLRIVHTGAGPAAGAGVVIVPIHGDSLALVRTYRYPVGEWQWGLPRGFAVDDDPLVTARIELREELGVTARELHLVGTFTPDSGLLASPVSVVLALVDDPSGHPEDGREVAEVRWATLPGLWAMAASGELRDGMTFAALTLAQATGALPQRLMFQQ